MFPTPQLLKEHYKANKGRFGDILEGSVTGELNFMAGQHL
jgi:hypothetical protein